MRRAAVTAVTAVGEERRGPAAGTGAACGGVFPGLSGPWERSSPLFLGHVNVRPSGRVGAGAGPVRHGPPALAPKGTGKKLAEYGTALVCTLCVRLGLFALLQSFCSLRAV